MNDARIDKRLEEMEDEVTLLTGYLSDAVEKSLGVRLDSVGGELADLKRDGVNLDELEKRLPDYSGRFDEIGTEVRHIGESVSTRLSDVDTALTNKLVRAVETVSEHITALREDLSTLREATGSIGARQIGDAKRLTEGMAGIGKQVETLSGKVPASEKQMLKKLGQVESGVASTEQAVRTSQEQGTKKLLEKLGQVESGVTSTEQAVKTGQKQGTEKLLKSLEPICESVEVLRRMCTTDEEKFLGGMTTVMYRHVNHLAEELPAVKDSIRKLFVAANTNEGKRTTMLLDMQAEAKKLILFDLDTVSTKLGALQSWCATLEDRPLGAEMLVTSDRVEEISDRVPDMHEKIVSFHDEVMNMSAEVRRMRWYVIGAASVSMIVLISSFFV